MKLPLRPSLSRKVVLSALGLFILIGVSAFQQLQIFWLKSDFASAANLETVNAITQRINGVDDRLDAASQLKPVTAEDFRAGQQALSNRIDAAQALLKQVHQASQDSAQTFASMGEVIVLAAKIEDLQLRLQELRTGKTVAQPAAPSTKTKPVMRKPVAQIPRPDPVPPFSVVGVEYRGGEKFLSVAPPGSTQLSQLYLVRPGDTVAGSDWRLNSLDDSRALFSINGSPRTVTLKP